MRPISFISALHIILAVSALAAPEPPSAAIYAQHCAKCHDAGGTDRIPPKSTLARLSPERIVESLTSGVMRTEGSALTAGERTDLAAWLSVAGKAAPAAGANLCSAKSVPVIDPRPGWTNWGDGLSNQRYQPDSGLTAKTVPRFELRWAFGVPDVNVMRSQPAVYRGRIYLGAENGSVTSLDAKTGCTWWTAKVKVRSGLTIGKAGSKEALFFGDVTGVVHALELATGKELWQTKVADHQLGFITGTPAYAAGRLYVPAASYEEVSIFIPNYKCCTFRGSLGALDAATGKILWQSHTIDAAPAAIPGGLGPSGAAVWSSPTIDSAHGAVYVTTGDNYSDPPTDTSDAVIAFDLQTGKRLWSKQFTTGDVFNLGCGKPGKGTCSKGIGPDFDFGSSPILVNLAAGKRCLLLGQKSGMVYAVDPDNKGEILWQARAGLGGALGGIQWGSATDGHLLYTAISDVHFLPGKDPAKMDLNPDVGGGISAFDVASGKLVWKAAPPICGDRRPCSPAQSAAVTAIDGAVFSGSLDGHIRAYSSQTGAVLWDFDTERSFDTVNHVAAEGGALDVSGAVVSGGMVYVSSGYPQYGGKGGNVFLAFGPLAN